MSKALGSYDAVDTIYAQNSRVGELFKGKRGLIVGIANADSIAFGCATKLRALGADLALTYQNDKSKVYVEPLAQQLGVELFLALDVTNSEQMQSVFDAIEQKWGRLDFIIHSIAFAPKNDLHGRIVDCSRDGFLKAMQISCHSFIEMAHYAEPLMTNGGAMITMTYYGSDKVIENYNMMGPVKAALESTVRYMAKDLGSKRIRVYAVSPGPIRTRAASGIGNFDDLIDMAVSRSPEGRVVDTAEIGRVVSFLVSEGASGMTGDVIYVDAGLHIVG
ncbi:MAG: enoyl-[acyl-carrier-protein] reductase [Pseudomonadota bacterium]|jgi:enoyl-[acyl-carrier protein] reductase I